MLVIKHEAPHITFGPGALRGRVTVAGDKSISHRALMIASLARGRSEIRNLNRGADVAATRDAMVAFGASIHEQDGVVYVGGGNLRSPEETIDARNSGTTVRMLMGLVAGSGLRARFDGDSSLRRRPMERIAAPLRAMGAQVITIDGRLPAIVEGISHPSGGTFNLPLPSAQVKSAILLAHVHATSAVRITGDLFSRDHTERMLRLFGAKIEWDGREITYNPSPLHAMPLTVPSDLSAAAFFLVGAAITPGSDLVIERVGYNPSRTGIIDALKSMGADLTVENQQEIDGEPVADLHIRGSKLHGVEIDGDHVVRAIDEVPVIAVAAACAEGTTIIRGASDLRAKESDRLKTMAALLSACGVAVEEYPDGLKITGGGSRPPTQIIETHDDHRIAMAAATLAAAIGPIEIDNARAVDVSFPGFAALWKSMQTT